MERGEYKIIEKIIPVSGLSCIVCANTLKKALIEKEGVKYVDVNFASSLLHIKYDEDKVNLKLIKHVVVSAGFDIIINNVESDFIESAEYRDKIRFKHLFINTSLSALFTIPIVLLSMLFKGVNNSEYIMWILSTPVLFIFGKQFFVNAWKQAKNFSANMDTLVALSTTIAYLFSVLNVLIPEYLIEKGLEVHVYFEAVGVIITFILLGRLLEERAKGKTSTALKKMMGLQPKFVTRKTKNGREENIPLSLVRIDDIVIVKPGGKVPVDGKLIEGDSYVDESMISGEAMPVKKTKGSMVFAGTINQKGSFWIKAEKVGRDTLLAQIVEMVRVAQNSKAPVQKLVDKLAAIFVPVVITTSLLSFIVWVIVGGENSVTHALFAMITVLIIACPCALGLATPTAIMVGIGKAAETGILIKNAESLELAHKLDTIIFDKTGTLTKGFPEVVSINWFNSSNIAYLKSVLFSIEKQSEHPLADSVVDYLKNDEIELLNISEFISVTGRGVQAKVDNLNFFIGNKKFIEEKTLYVEDNQDDLINEWKSLGYSLVYFASKEKLLAIISFSDKLKETTPAAINELKRMGINLYMLTGDNEYTAEFVAKELQLKYKAQLMPSNKADFIKNLQSKGNIIGMVGDGINDSLAMAQANVSIAMGKGSDIAMDVAMMTIISSDLGKIPQALRLSKNTVRTIKENLFWAFLYNVLGIPIAAGILYPITGYLLSPMLAGAAMAMSSVCVVFNSLRLKIKSV